MSSATEIAINKNITRQTLLRQAMRLRIKTKRGEPDARAILAAIINSVIPRKDYDRQISQYNHQRTQMRFKLYALGIVPTDKKQKELITALNNAGFSIRKLYVMKPSASVRSSNSLLVAIDTTKNSGAYMRDQFHAATEARRNKCNANPPEVIKKGKLLTEKQLNVVCAKAAKAVAKKHPRATGTTGNARKKPSFPPTPAYDLPVRNPKKNNALPDGLRLEDITPLAMVRVAWNDGPPSLVLLTEVEYPEGSRQQVIRSSYINCVGLAANGGERRFQSDQILSLAHTAGDSVTRLFGAESDDQDDEDTLKGQLRSGHLLTVEASGGVHEMVHPDDLAVLDDYRAEDVKRELEDEDGPNSEFRKAYLMCPDCAPAWFWVAKSNTHALKYEVDLKFVNR